MEQFYDDFAEMTEANCKSAGREFALKKARVLRASFTKTDKERLYQKIGYLQKIMPKLKNHTQNQDILNVLQKIDEQITAQKKQLDLLFENFADVQSCGEDVQIFCNNLKLAIQTTNEIVELLIKIKDDDSTPIEIRPQITDVINQFLNINSEFVSLFGECRYRKFVQKYQK